MQPQRSRYKVRAIQKIYKNSWADENVREKPSEPDTVTTAIVVVNRRGVEKLTRVPSKTTKVGDRKCLRESRTPFIRHPDAILFLRISRKGVFQQPQAIIRFERKCQSNHTVDRLNP